jgi:hypothetical protein
MRKYLVIILLVIASCADKEKFPEEIIPPEKMEHVLWDMITAGEFYNSQIARLDSSYNKDSAMLDTYARVFQIHKIKREDFDRSYDWYKQHPDEMSVILDSLSKRSSPDFIKREKQPLKDSIRKRPIQQAPIEIR